MADMQDSDARFLHDQTQNDLGYQSKNANALREQNYYTDIRAMVIFYWSLNVKLEGT